MICPKCGKELSNPKLKFCTGCGNPLSTSAPSTPPSEPEWKKFRESESSSGFKSAPTFSTIPEESKEVDLKSAMGSIEDKIEKTFGRVSTKKKYVIPNNLSPDFVTPTEGEIPIKQYVFSKMKFPLVQYMAEGVLQVTNKRIIYNLIGSSILGYERTHSEFSIDDVAGISVEKSTRFNLIILLAYFLLSLPLFGFAFGLVMLGKAYIALVLAAIGVFGAYLFSKTNHSFIYHCISAFSCDLAIAGMTSSTEIDVLDIIFKIIFAAGIGFFVYHNVKSYLKSLVKPTISVVVTSKSGAAQPINCSQVSVASVSASCIKNLCDTLPTAETQVMMTELGAMVYDIQKMGDYAIEKWRRK